MAWYDNLLGIKREGTLEKLNPAQPYYDHKTEPSRELTFNYERAYEDLEIVNDHATITIDTIKKDQNVHFKAQDRKEGELIVAKNTKISAAEIGVGASIGKTMVKVMHTP